MGDSIRRAMVLVIVLADALLIAAGSALAGEPEAATLVAAQVFTEVPNAVELSFDSSIDLQSVQIIVVGPNGARADDGVSRTTAQGVRSTLLRSGLGDGDYLVAWISGPAGYPPDRFGLQQFTVRGSRLCQPLENATSLPAGAMCLADPPTGRFGTAVSIDAISVTLALQENEPGSSVALAATVTSAAGEPLVDAEVVFRSLQTKDGAVEPPVLATETAPGVYTATGFGREIGDDGIWAVDVVALGELPITVFFELAGVA